jgi:hypothetical protein
MSSPQPILRAWSWRTSPACRQVSRRSTRTSTPIRSSRCRRPAPRISPRRICGTTATNAPSLYWFVGGADPEIYATAKAEGRINDLAATHSPKFAPVIPPALETGVEAMVAGALAWLAK